MSARAAMEAARAVFELSAGRPPDAATSAPVWTTPSVPCATPRQRAEAMWNAAEQTLRDVAGNATLSGQELIAEVRRLERLTLDDAHALVALHGWTEQIRHPEPDQRSEHVDVEQTPSAFEMRIASEVWAALEHAIAPFEAHVDVQRSPPLSPSVPLPVSETPHEPTRRAWYASPGMVLVFIALVIAGPAVGWWYYRTQQPHHLRDGIVAYERGASEVARMAFTDAAKENPADVTPLIYLGRIDREAHDYGSAKKFLAEAIQQQPANAVALREMAATLLAEGQPELARRFYVRTLEHEPGDRLAQGFLACALFQLGRVDESARWAARAGPGGWSACVRVPADSAAVPTSPASRP